MIERKFKINVDAKTEKKGKPGFSIEDIMDFRRRPTDLEIAIKTPDQNIHTKYISRAKFRNIVRLEIQFVIDDIVEWGVT